MNAPLLEVRGLTMRFGGLLAIDSLDLTARNRDITAIIGPNGAGKTTVFNCLTGFYQATGGRLRLNHPQRGELFLEKLPGHQVAAKAGVVRTFQNIRLFARMTLLENLLVAQHNKLMRASYYTIGGLFGLPACQRMEKLAVEKACFWLERMKLIDKADQEAGTLPYGAQRRLEIARAMCAEPVLLCLDEPAAGLNPRESADLNELLLTIRKEREIAILLIEHDMSVVMQISDRIYVLDHGKRISAGTPVEIRNDPAVINAYLGEDDGAAQLEARRGEDA